MKFFEFFKIGSGKKDLDLKKTDFIEDAKKAAQIVTKVIEKNDYSDLNSKLEEISISTHRDKYVFEADSEYKWIWLLLLSNIISLFFLNFLVIYGRTIGYSSSYRIKGIIGISLSMTILLLNIFISIKCIKETRYIKRYNKYYSVLKHRNIVLMDDLESISDEDRAIIENDLIAATTKKLIPQGNFSNNKSFFIASKSLYDDYIKHKAVYERYFKKKLDERKSMKNRANEIDDLLKKGQEYIEKIHDSNDLIKDKEVTSKLDKMENVVSTIFQEVKINPSQANKLSLFMSYYLPTTEKLLEAYLDIDEKQLIGKKLTDTKNNIKNALDSINTAFESLLERFYEEQELNVAGEISALEVIMHQEGLIKDEQK